MFTALKNVTYTKTPRLSTGISELDWIYGGEDSSWGLPLGKISLWSGPSGTGKSRSLIHMCKKMSSNGLKIMYFQNEVPLSDMRSWTGPGYLSPTFYGSESTKLEDQISDIVQSKANLVIVDSISQIKEFKTGHETAVKHIYSRYRDLCKKTGIHVIFICQLDKSYRIKGSTEILYLADISVDLDFHIVNKLIVKNEFCIGINGRNGGKHRYGEMGEDITTVWEHTPDGARCISKNRLYTDKWCNSHNLDTMTRLKVEMSPPPGHYGKPIIDPVSGGTYFLPIGF